ncbi:MAG: acyltransferase family protein [Lachnospiraceae bacterium]|nr:acyltransferase family protein [Lachnospiraceae bacterium]
MTEKKINPRFRILSALAIIFVVAGHANLGVFDMAGMFPYYSFHVGVFVFISGYFYKVENEYNIKNYLIKKMRHLLLPYYLWNLIYGIVVTGLHGFGFQIGSTITIKSLLLDPFLGGHQYGFNFAAWFVPVLFLIEVMNIFLRKLLDVIHLKKEIFILVSALVIGILVVWLAKRGSVWGYYKHIGCVLFLFPMFQMGHFYKNVLEEKIEKIPKVYYFGIVLLIQYVTVLWTKGQIGYSAVWCTGFGSSAWVPYVTTATGILFWLGVATLIEPLWKPGNVIDIIGKNSFSIMMHHMLGFWIVNTILYFVSRVGNVFSDFDSTMYFTSYEYRYLIGSMENSKWIYLLVGILFSLCIKKIEESVKKMIFTLKSK